MPKDVKVKIKGLNNNKFLVEYLHPTNQKRKRHQFNTYKEAMAFKEETEFRFLTDGDNPYLDRPIGQLIEAHIEEWPNTGLLERKNNFLDFYNTFCNMKLKDLTANDLRKWFEKRKTSQDYSDRTLNHIRGNLGHFFRYLIEIGALKASPLSEIRFKQNPPPKRPRVYLTSEEIKEILDQVQEYSPEFLFPLFYLLVHTGARRSEVIHLKWSNVDFKRGVLTYYETKNKIHRTIKLSDRLYSFLEKLTKQHEYVLVNPSGQQVGRSQLNRFVTSFKSAYPRNKNWTLHSFRHSFAYNFLKKGGHMYELQAILGHKSIHLTIDLYGRLRSEDVENPSPFNF